MHGEGGGKADRREAWSKVRGGCVLVSLLLQYLFGDTLSVGLSLPICKLELTRADAGWQEGPEALNEQAPGPPAGAAGPGWPALGAAPTPGHCQAQTGHCLWVFPERKEGRTQSAARALLTSP